MQYTFSHIEIKDVPADKQNGGKKYVTALASRVGDTNDNGFRLNIFNPEIVQAAMASYNETGRASFSLDCEIDSETVSLGQVYCRKDQNGQPVVNQKTGKIDLYKSIKVHVMYTYQTRPAFVKEGPNKGMRLMQQDYRLDGTPFMRPAVEFILDDMGQPIKQYMTRWSPEERKNDVLAAFFMLAPAQYQQVIQQAAPEAPIQQQPNLQDAAASIFGQPPVQQPPVQPQQQAPQQQGFAIPGQQGYQPQPQQQVTQQIDPLAGAQ